MDARARVSARGLENVNATDARHRYGFTDVNDPTGRLKATADTAPSVGLKAAKATADTAPSVGQTEATADACEGWADAAEGLGALERLCSEERAKSREKPRDRRGGRGPRPEQRGRWGFGRGPDARGVAAGALAA